MVQSIILTSFIVLQVLYLLNATIVVLANNNTAPQEITETWDGHTAKLSLVFNNQNVAIYYDDQVKRNNSWEFSPITKAWKYATDTYGAFGPNPLLYIFIHASKYKGCRCASHLQLAYKSRNVIDCGEVRGTDSIFYDSEYYTHRILTSIGRIIRFGANGILNDADFEVCRDEIKNILSYDTYTLSGNHLTKLAGWKKEKTYTSRSQIFWFRDWFLPIYEQFGRSQVLKKYLNLTFFHLPHSTTNYLKNLNVGEFVHFWSMAAGMDLSEIAIQTFTTNYKYHNELVQARKSYPFFSYEVNKCDFGQYECDNTFCVNITSRCNGTAECSDRSDELNCQTCSTTAFQCSGGGCIPQNWRCDNEVDCPDESDEKNCEGCSSDEFQCTNGRCIKESYRCDTDDDCSDGSDERNCSAPKEITETWDGHTAKLSLVFNDQNVVIYYDNQVKRNNNWEFAPITKAWKYATDTYGAFGPNPLLYIFIHAFKYEACRSASYLQLAYKNRNVVDCGENRVNDSIYDNSEYYTHRILTSIGRIIRLGANGLLNDADFTVCGDEMSHILSYEIYILNGNHSTNLAGWKNRKTESLRRNIFWFRDWFLPIYEQFGRSQVLKKYLNLTFFHLPHSTTNYLKNLNEGEFIHFWSMAAGMDLSEIAIQTFTRNNNYQNELVQARKSYPFFSYKVKTCDFGQYECNNTFCINITRRCDGTADCSDRSDEQNCQTCSIGAFRCSSGSCIPQTGRCDNEVDCSDESDERNCKVCSSDNFQCDSGQCIQQSYRCDQDEDCLDGSDERNCSAVVCSSDKFQCTSGRCIKQSYRCDADDDCSDGSDEINCSVYKQRDPSFVYIDKNVGIRFEDKVDKNVTWPFSPLSKAWEYTRNKYGPFGPKHRLHIFIGVSKNEYCTAESYLQKTSSSRNKIQCDEQSSSDDSKPVVFKNFFRILTSFGHIVRFAANGLLNDADVDVCGGEMREIISYDIYNMIEDPSRKLAHWKNERIGSSLGGIFWFRDWFLQIYEQFDGSKVLNKYLNLTFSHLPHSTKNYNQKLNEGEFVHFWSMAAGADLSEIAHQTFTSNTNYQEELIQARESYPFFNFDVSCTSDQFKCNNTFCISLARRCDGKTDCSDESDEANCEDTTSKISETSDAVPIVVGIFVLVILAILIGVGIKIVSYRRKIQNLDQQIRNLTNEEVDEFLGGNLNLNDNDGNGPIHSMPFISDYEIASEQLVINEQRVLGSGAFGIVKEGKLQCDQYSRNTDQTVAVKMVKERVNVGDFKAFLLEIKIMAFLGQHQNIVSLLGTVTSNIQNCEVFVALEFCSNGDLLHFVRDNCELFEDLLHSNVEKDHTSGHNSDRNIPPNSTDVETCLNYNDLSISTVHLLEWSRQIADGMNYLTTKKVIHGDLAARNVLLTGDKTAKIGDFGLSRQLMNYSNYLKTSVTPLPWRWLAIESLSSSTFSVHSDVWAFGVTLWEIFTLGKLPYPGRSWDHGFVDELTKGMRLNSPQYGNKKIYDLMMNCMKLVPGDRIPFAQIGVELQAITENIISKNDGPSTSQGGSTATYITLE